MGQRMVIIADDLTGANDTAVQFWRQGFATVVMVGEGGFEDALANADVVALNLDSRIDPPEVAAEKVRTAARALRRVGVHHLYKKIDSTLRGNLGAETDALIEEMKLPAAVVTPAFPATSRAVIGGYLVVNGIPVTEVVHDERVSAARGHLPTLLRAQSRLGVHALELPEVAAGVDILAEAMGRAIEGGARQLAVDASTDEHLRTIVQAAEAARTGGLLVGSGGLAGALAAELASKVTAKDQPGACPAAASQAAPRYDITTKAAVLVLAGSYSAVTARQVEVAVDAGASLVEVNLAKALGVDDRAADVTAEVIAATLGPGHSTIMRPVGPLRPGAELQVAALMAEVAQRTLGKTGLSGLFLTGGDIAMATCRALGATSIAIVGEVAPGLPAGRLQGGPYAGLQVVTKAGAFGAEDAIQRAIEYLSTDEA